MCELGTVYFDKMVVNTDLAVQYFKQKNNVFRSSTSLKFQDVAQESDGHNTIQLSSCENQDIKDYVSLKKCSSEQVNSIYEKLLKLADLVEKNVEMFGQIEYAIRNIPVVEVKNYDIKLIVQNLLCRSYMKVERYIMNNPVYGIMMNADTPLAHIGYVAQLLMDRAKVLIFATKKTAAICYLFTELCQKVGLDSVEIIFLTEQNHSFKDMVGIPAKMNGCVGVITEKSDLDSAVDVLLRTTTKYPWKLTRICVQESIYDRFKKVLALKSRSIPDTTSVPDTIEKLCDNTYACDGKLFMVDYAGTSDHLDINKVLVEAYRTTKELIALVAKYEAPYVSLWSSDLSEANEIATKAPSSFVWINSYGIFDGPPESSQAIYKELFKVMPLYGNVQNINLVKQQVNWAKNTFEERRKILYKLLDSIRKGPFSKKAEDLIAALGDLENDDFVSVENGRICMGLSVSRDAVCIRRDAEWHAPYIARLLTTGAALFLPHNNYELSILDILDSEIPTTSGEVHATGDQNTIALYPYASRTKVIWTNFGTIFAN